MSLLRNITSGLRSLFRKDQVDRELNEELGGYLEMAAAEKMKQGMSRMDALRAVRLERGNLEVAATLGEPMRCEAAAGACFSFNQAASSGSRRTDLEMRNDGMAPLAAI